MEEEEEEVGSQPNSITTHLSPHCIVVSDVVIQFVSLLVEYTSRMYMCITILLFTCSHTCHFFSSSSSSLAELHQLSTTAPACSWPLSEFPSGPVSVVYTCCVELMGGPLNSKAASTAVVSALIARYNHA